MLVARVAKGLEVVRLARGACPMFDRIIFTADNFVSLKAIYFLGNGKPRGAEAPRA
tara:strand:- start:698 stop:865 length:168 start_codon:yes stop_codon:yes gene_type:complete